MDRGVATIMVTIEVPRGDASALDASENILNHLETSGFSGMAWTFPGAEINVCVETAFGYAESHGCVQEGEQ